MITSGLRIHLGRQDGTIIVTNPTTKGSVATRRNHGALSIVMSTRRTGLFFVFGLLITFGLYFCTVHAAFGFPVSHIRVGGCSVTAGDGGVATVRGAGVGEAVASAVHQVLDGASFFHGSEGSVGENGLDASSALFLFGVGHTPSSLHRLVVFVAHVDGRRGLLHFVVHALRFIGSSHDGSASGSRGGVALRWGHGLSLGADKEAQW